MKMMEELKPCAGRYDELTGFFLRYFLKTHPGENIFFSPLSVLMLLSMAADATAGETRRQITDLLGGPEVKDAGALLGAFQSMLGAGGEFSSANAVCIRKDVLPAARKDCLSLLERRYGAEVFRTEDAVKKINNWVRRKTRGMIDGAVDESAADELMFMLNAVAFEGTWADPYEDEDIAPGRFYNAGGSASLVSMLNGGGGRYIEDGCFTGFVKDYEKREYEFMALLPKEKGQEALGRALEGIRFRELYEGSVRTGLRTAMPEYSFDFSAELIPACRELGIRDVFTSEADFSPLSAAPLKADSLRHAARIEVDRRGTRAAALTMMFCGGCPPPDDIKEVVLDRPFVFAVTHRLSGLPVFAGTVNRL